MYSNDLEVELRLAGRRTRASEVEEPAGRARTIIEYRQYVIVCMEFVMGGGGGVNLRGLIKLYITL